jgi:3-methylcrotonyl-CoA carboxylase alpha subunit
VVKAGDTLHVFDHGAHHVFAVIDPYLPPAQAADAHGGLTAPMPGRVLAVLVKPGDRVARGAPLMVMEAMKMEHTVTAPAAGTIASIHHVVGDQVREGDELLTVTPT